MGLGSLLVRGVPVGVQTVLPLPRQWSFVSRGDLNPCRFSFGYFSNPGPARRVGEGDFGDWVDRRTSLFLPGERGRRFSGLGGFR